MNNKIQATNFNKTQISELAQLFGKYIDYSPLLNNLRQCVENIGGSFEYADSKLDSIGGAIDVRNKNDFKIFLSPVPGPQRTNFTIAHELGHYVLHSRLGEVPIVANRDEKNHSLIEREANLFAAELLMPSSILCDEMKNHGNDLDIVSKLLNVSKTALRWRCQNIGIEIPSQN